MPRPSLELHDAIEAGDLTLAFDNVEPACRQKAVEDATESFEVHGVMAEKGDHPLIHVYR